MKSKITLTIILCLLLAGFIFRLVISQDGNFIFHMDNARDMVDIRHMVVTQKPRLIGPTSGIEGLFNGPAWYYLMAVPFLVGKGDPYALVIAQMIFWVIGGGFLLLVLRKWGLGELIIGSLIWIFSPLLILSSQNALSTNPIPFLMPVFFWLLINALNNPVKFNRWHFGLWTLTGLFFQLEMAFTFLLPMIILVIFQFNNKEYWRSKVFIFGIVSFSVWLLPQLLFDLRHQWIMTKSVLYYLTQQSVNQIDYNPLFKLEKVFGLYYSQLSALLMNSPFIVGISCITILSAARFKDKLYLSCLILFVGSILIYVLVPVTVMSWHILGHMTGWLLLFMISLQMIKRNYKLGNFFYYLIIMIVIINSLGSLQNLLKNIDNLKSNTASYYNQIKTIDEVYRQANGRNFKTYVYMPSVIDYPYQYLFWWYGLKKFGYTPMEYAYLPNQPGYIADKSLFNFPARSQDSGLVFLIKEPDHNYTRPGWEGQFINYEIIDKQVVGPIEIETRKIKQ